jgi:hypothetical protein
MRVVEFDRAVNGSEYGGKGLKLNERGGMNSNLRAMILLRDVGKKLDD